MKLISLILTILGSCLLVIIIALTDLIFERDKRLSALKNELTQFTAVLSEHAERSLEAVAITVSLTAEELEKKHSWTELQELELHTLLKSRQLEVLPQSRELILFDAEGYQRARTYQYPTNAISNVTDRPYFIRNKAGDALVFSPPFQGRNTGKWTFAVSHRINTKSGHFAGLVFSAIEPDYFRHLYKKISPFTHYSALIYYDDQTIMMSTDDENDTLSQWTGQRYSNHPAWTEDVLHQGTSTISDPTDWFSTTVQIPNSPYYLAVSVHKDEITENWHSYVLKTGLAATIIITLIIVLGIVAYRKVQQSEGKYQLLFNEMLSGFALHQVILNESGEVEDYMFLEANPAFERLTGLDRTAILGRTIREVLPEVEDTWIQRLGAVALTGQSDHFTEYSKHLKRYYEAYAFCPRTGQFGVTFTDISDRIIAEEALQKA